MKLRQRFIDMKLSKKLIGVFLVTGILPAFVVFLATSRQMQMLLAERETTSLEQYLKQAGVMLDNEISIYDNLSNYISFNETIANVIANDEDSDYQKYSDLVNIVDPMLSSLMYFHQDIRQVTIFTDTSMVAHGNLVMPLSEIQNTSWYEEVKEDNQIHWFAVPEEKKLFSAARCVMLGQKNINSILYIDVDFDSVFSVFEHPSMENTGIAVLDADGDFVYHEEFFDESKKRYSLTDEDFLIEKGQGNYHFTEYQSETAGWTLYLYKPESLLLPSMKPLALLALIGIAACLIFCTLGVYFVTRYVTRRIHNLQAGMKEAESGKLDVVIENDSQDEIGDLIVGFESMLKKLDQSINEVYKSQIAQKEYEMKALQAQINPHFLYNSLSIINWKAIEAGQEDISRITLSLSSFYRTSLNKGKNLMSVSDEIENVKAYLNIQKFMHDDSFDVKFDIDSDILSCQTLNLILQPLLENAIHHGIDLLTDRRGLLTIRGYKKDGMVYLVVTDNGIGMDEEQCKKIITAESHGYGVRNVNERICLYYGKEYSIKIDSIVGEGTVVTVHFPAIR